MLKLRACGMGDAITRSPLTRVCRRGRCSIVGEAMAGQYAFFTSDGDRFPGTAPELSPHRFLPFATGRPRVRATEGRCYAGLGLDRSPTTESKSVFSPTPRSPSR